jgi:hypothetical protein
VLHTCFAALLAAWWQGKEGDVVAASAGSGSRGSRIKQRSAFMVRVFQVACALFMPIIGYLFYKKVFNFSLWLCSYGTR